MTRYVFVVSTGASEVRCAWCEVLPCLAAVRDRVREALFGDAAAGEWGPGENVWMCRVDCTGNRVVYAASLTVPRPTVGCW